jgi:hypothetical protein
MDMITVTTDKHGTYSAPADVVSSATLLYRYRGSRVMLTDWCELTGTPEYLWQDITEMSTWAVMLASKMVAPLTMRSY